MFRNVILPLEEVIALIFQFPNPLKKEELHPLTSRRVNIGLRNVYNTKMIIIQDRSKVKKDHLVTKARRSVREKTLKDIKMRKIYMIIKNFREKMKMKRRQESIKSFFSNSLI
tara:strand:+ start:420 stop:758 length:339 start_codon:yes stop_codon:yes gene_type:complete